MPVIHIPSSTAALFNVGAGSNPPTSLPDPTKGNVAGVWGFVGSVISAPSQISAPPITCGVFGQSEFSGGVGVHGLSGGGEGVEPPNGCGLYGEAHSWPNNAVFGSSNEGHGVHGINGTGGGSTPSLGCGIWGESKGGHGVYGVTAAQEGYGVLEITNAAWPCVAVQGLSDSGHGVKGVSGAASGVSPGAVCGVWGNSKSGWGVFGSSTSGDGVHGETLSAGDSAVAGVNSAGGNGVYGYSTGNAGYFDGNVSVTGNMTVAGDHLCNGNASVAGNMTVTGNHLCNGTVTAVVDVMVGGQDCAELFDLKLLEIAEPGAVMVIDADGALRQSQKAYDRAVAGVVSGAGEFRPGIVLGQRADNTGRAKIALVGKVCCKVDADVAPIAVGDLLTSSDTPGHAMKASDPARAFGAVIGKALRPMTSGRGLLPILIALQ